MLRFSDVSCHTAISCHIFYLLSCWPVQLLWFQDSMYTLNAHCVLSTDLFFLVYLIPELFIFLWQLSTQSHRLYLSDTHPLCSTVPILGMLSSPSGRICFPCPRHFWWLDTTSSRLTQETVRYFSPWDFFLFSPNFPLCYIWLTENNSEPLHPYVKLGSIGRERERN